MPHVPAEPQLTGRFRTEAIPAVILDELIEIRARTVLHTLGPVSHRNDERTVLIGDAAHPAGAGQGASMALEDAVVLGRELAISSNISSALDSFDDVRHARAANLRRWKPKIETPKSPGRLPPAFARR
jgi:salicylate hydroxylase